MKNLDIDIDLQLKVAASAKADLQDRLEAGACLWCLIDESHKALNILKKDLRLAAEREGHWTFSTELGRFRVLPQSTGKHRIQFKKK